MAHYDIITIGNATRDIFLQNPHYPVLRNIPRQGETSFVLPIGAKIDIPTLVFATGGGASNAAATFANFGYRVAFLGKTGKDRRGEYVIEDMRERGIDTSLVYRDPTEPTAYSVILTAPHYGRTVLTHRSSSAALKKHFLPLEWQQAQWLYVTSLGGNVSLLRWILGVARKNRSAIMCNPGAPELRKRSMLLPILAQIAVVLLNREEGNQLAGTRGLGCGSVARRLAKLLPSIIVITDGKKGAVARAGQQLFQSGTHAVTHAVEWTGAGDAFGSGFLTGLLQTKGDVRAALHYGTANAESVLTEIGAKNGLLTVPPRPSACVAVHVQKLSGTKGGDGA